MMSWIYAKTFKAHAHVIFVMDLGRQITHIPNSWGEQLDRVELKDLYYGAPHFLFFFFFDSVSLKCQILPPAMDFWDSCK